MKAWLIAVLGLILFVFLAVLNQSMLKKNTHELSGKLIKVETAILSQKWIEAEQLLKPVQTRWERIKPVWSILLRHQEIDAIDQALIRTKRAIRSQDLAAAEVEQGSLMKYVEHIPKREQFSISNIF